MSRLWRAYESSLGQRPLATKMATSLTLMTIGDATAQKLTPASGADSGKGWDYGRTAAMGGLGLLVHAPYFHCWCTLCSSPTAACHHCLLCSHLLTAAPPRLHLHSSCPPRRPCPRHSPCTLLPGVASAASKSRDAVAAGNG